MQKRLFYFFKILLWIVLAGKISGWFFDYSDRTNEVLNIAMFSLIGVAYVYLGFIWDRVSTKIIYVTCGLYLIIMKFLTDSTILNIIGIACIITPLLLARFLPKEADEEELIES